MKVEQHYFLPVPAPPCIVRSAVLLLVPVQLFVGLQSLIHCVQQCGLLIQECGITVINGEFVEVYSIFKG
jgi:hypothetical protein